MNKMTEVILGRIRRKSWKLPVNKNQFKESFIIRNEKILGKILAEIIGQIVGEIIGNSSRNNGKVLKTEKIVWKMEKIVGEIVKNSGKNRGKILEEITEKTEGKITEKIQALEINKENLRLIRG